MKQSKDTVSTCELVLQSLELLDKTPYVSAVRRALKDQRYLDLVKMPMPETTNRDFPLDYFAWNILRKFPFKGLDRKKAALAAYQEGEQVCAETNKRFNRWYDTLSGAQVNDIHWLREKIRSALGPFCWNRAAADFAFGPGATTRLKNAQGDVYYKFRGIPETTRQNFDLAAAAIQVIPTWWSSLSQEEAILSYRPLRVVAGSKVTTVPKDAKTDRTIAIEPDMNMYVQKGIGSMIRSRLLRVGVDLNDQTKQQLLARDALSKGYATIDLSMASDTVAYKVVETLLPEDWFAALQQCRSPRYVLNNSIRSFEKFSTMGNGYTFELESLIFWAITSLAVERSFAADKTIGIYGDDIILHDIAVPCLLELLTLFGFKPNVQKSFWGTSPFRESCGKHFLHGVDVTPVYVKDRIDTAERHCWFANSLALWAERMAASGYRSQSISAWYQAYSSVPEDWKLPIPHGVGDGGTVMPHYQDLPVGPLNGEYFTYEEVRRGIKSSSLRASNNYCCGYWYDHWALVKVPTRDRDPTDVPYLLRQLYRLEQLPKVCYTYNEALKSFIRVGEFSDNPETGIIENFEWRVVRSFYRGSSD